MVDEDTDDDGGDEPAQLGHDEDDVVHGEDLAGNDAADPDGSEPDDAGDHFHDHVKDDGEEVDDDFGSLAESAEDGAEGEAEDDDSDGIGAGAVLEDRNCDVDGVEEATGFVKDALGGVDVVGVSLKRKRVKMGLKRKLVVEVFYKG